MFYLCCYRCYRSWEDNGGLPLSLVPLEFALSKNIYQFTEVCLDFSIRGKGMGNLILNFSLGLHYAPTNIIKMELRNRHLLRNGNLLQNQKKIILIVIVGSSWFRLETEKNLKNPFSSLW